MVIIFFFVFRRHGSSLVGMVIVTYLYVDMEFGFYGYFFSLNTHLLLSWIFEHDYLDTCCFRCLICMCFVFLYLHLFSPI